MTPRAALLDLVARVGARDGAAVRVSEPDVRQWPAEAVAALKAHRFLVRARPARTVVCPGCEADCVMPEQTIPAGPRAAARFIVCDKRSDINRVALTTAHVDQWKCDAEALARFVVAQLGLRRSRHRVDASGTRPIGLAAGDTRHQMLGLRTHGDEWITCRHHGGEAYEHVLVLCPVLMSVRADAVPDSRNVVL